MEDFLICISIHITFWILFGKNELRLYETLLRGNDPEILIQTLREDDIIFVNVDCSLKVFDMNEEPKMMNFIKDQELIVTEGHGGKKYPYITVRDRYWQRFKLYAEDLDKLQIEFEIMDNNQNKLKIESIPFTLEEIQMLREISWESVDVIAGCPVLEDLGCIRLNGHKEFYMVLPKQSLTTAQYNSLDNWFDKVLLGENGSAHKSKKQSFSITTMDGKQQQYDALYSSSDDLIKKIKRYYSSGTLVEDLEDTETLPSELYHSIVSGSVYNWVIENGITPDSQGMVYLSLNPIVNSTTVACFKVTIPDMSNLYNWEYFWLDEYGNEIDFDHEQDPNNPYYIYLGKIPLTNIEELNLTHPLDENLSPLKTLNGSIIKRSNYGVGKDMGAKFIFINNMPWI